MALSANDSSVELARTTAWQDKSEGEDKKDEAVADEDEDVDPGVDEQELISDDNMDIYTLCSLMFVREYREHALCIRLKAKHRHTLRYQLMRFYSLITIALLLFATVFVQIALPWVAIQWVHVDSESLLNLKWNNADSTTVGNVYWFLFFGFPYFVVGLTSASNLLDTVRCTLSIWAVLKPNGCLTAKGLLWFSIYLNVASYVGSMVLAYLILTDSAALSVSGTEQVAYPKLIDIIKDIVALTYLLTIDSEVYTFLVKAEHILPIEKIKHRPFMQHNKGVFKNVSIKAIAAEKEGRVVKTLYLVHYALLYALVSALPIIALVISQLAWTSECADLTGKSENFIAECTAVFEELSTNSTA